MKGDSWAPLLSSNSQIEKGPFHTWAPRVFLLERFPELIQPCILSPAQMTSVASLMGADPNLVT